MLMKILCVYVMGGEAGRGEERKWNKENILLFFWLVQSEDWSSPGVGVVGLLFF